MKIKNLFSYLAISCVLSACAERQNIVVDHSEVLNQDTCRINYVPILGKENLYKHNSLGLLKYNSGKILAWIHYSKKEDGRNKVEENPKVLFKLFKNNALQEEITFKSETHNGFAAYIKKHNDTKAIKNKSIAAYNPSFPSEDIWPSLKNKSSLMYIVGLNALAFEITEEQLNKFENADHIKVYIETKERPLSGEINKEGLIQLREFKTKCWDKNFLQKREGSKAAQ